MRVLRSLRGFFCFVLFLANVNASKNTPTKCWDVAWEEALFTTMDGKSCAASQALVPHNINSILKGLPGAGTIAAPSPCLMVRLTVFSMFGFRVWAHLPVRRKRTLPQRGLSLVNLSGAGTVTLQLPARSGGKTSASPLLHFWGVDICGYFATAGRRLCTYGRTSHQNRGGGWTSLQVPDWCLDFFPPSFLFPPLMSTVVSKCLKTVFLSQIGLATASEQNSKAST